MICNYCGKENQEGASFCENCGSQLSPQQNEQPSQQYENNNHAEQNYGVPPQNNYYSQPQGGQNYNAPPPQYMPPPQQQGYYNGPIENSKNATPALVFGILSLLCGGVLWFILAIVFGSKGIKEQKERGLSTAMPMTGLILGIVGAVIWGIVLIAFLPYLTNIQSIMLF